MIRSLTWTSALACSICLCSWATAQSPPRKAVLIDTDLGTGIDDAFALGLAFGSYELDVQGVTTVGDDTHQRAMMMCRLLTMTGRRHTRVAAGAKPQPSRPITALYKYYYHPDALFDRTTKPEKTSAAEFLHARLKSQPGKITLLALGPLTNVAALLAAHPDSGALIERIVLVESNLALDAAAARKVIAAGIPLVVVSSEACQDLRLDAAGVKRVFSPGTPLTRQVETMYQMWEGSGPPLGEALAVAISFDERLARIEPKALSLDDSGALKSEDSKPNARVVTSVEPGEFARWYADRMAALVAPASKPSRVIEDERMPRRVHVAEDFDSDIERFWWMSGKDETRLLPPGSMRACRGVLTHDFDDLLMASRQMYTAVIFNPVPGPPMGKNSRLRFRYWLDGTNTIRVQIYSLTNGYHRQLVITGLPQKQWQQATVDMTTARRPDGTGGPLGENERIDDIQFYVDPNAQLVIDDVVLYDAAPQSERRPFPKRIMFTGLFDTGKQGEHWPGDFEIVADAGNFWRAARSVENSKTGHPWIRLGLRGQRKLGQSTHVSFRYRLDGADRLQLRLLDTKSGKSRDAGTGQLQTGKWEQTTVEFATKDMGAIDEIHVLLPKGAELLMDDVLLYEP